MTGGARIEGTIDMTTKWAIKNKYGDFEVVYDAGGQPHSLGEGTFGITVEAVRKRRVGGREIVDRYALKILDPTLFESATLRAQFITELTSVQGIIDSNLVRYNDYGEQDGQPYVVMDLCSGGDLGELVRRLRAPLSERLAARIGVQVAKGLQCMHERKMVHRDIKPGNIMLACGTRPHSAAALEALLSDASLCRIVDFGLIKSTEAATDAAARKHFFGTLRYASPEQISRRKDIDGRSDIYALGMTLWHLVKGESPLADSERKLDDSEVEERHLSEREHEADFPAGLSAEFRAILARMVAKDREKRHRSAEELGDELRHFLARTATAAPVTAHTVDGRPTLETILKRVQAAGAKYLIPIDGVLENVFSYKPVRGGGGRRFDAVQIGSDRRGRLTLEHLPERAEELRKDLEKVTANLVERAWRINHPSAPRTFLGDVAVVRSHDALAWFEEHRPDGVTLADVIKARTNDDRAITFQEAAEVFQQIAVALDHIAHLSWNVVSLPAEAVFLTCDGMAGDLKRRLLTPLDQWENLRVRFSGMCIPPPPGRKSRKLIDPSDAVTGSAGIAAPEELRHPLKAFLRLVYHTRTGEVLIPAADRHAREYVQTDKMGGAANNLIRDQLSSQPMWEAYPEKLTADISDTLNKLCRYEGVSDTDVPVPVPFGDYVTKGEAPSARPASTASVTASPPTKHTTLQGTSRPLTATRSGTSAPPVVTPEVLNQPLPADQPRSTDEAREAAARSAKIVSPGRVRLGQSEQDVSPGTWGFPGPFGDFVRCASTGLLYSLPRHRPPLIGQIVAPHLVRSPFVLKATVETAQRVEWADWKPGARIKCDHTDEVFLLPLDLIYPEGILPAEGTGRIISPYDRSQTAEEVDPAAWKEGNKIECLATGRPLIFVLPAKLPPLLALADAETPGRFRSPYAEAKGAWTDLAPTQWFSGTQVKCPSGKTLVLPEAVDQWIAEAVIEDVAARRVRSSYFENEICDVPVRDWKRGGVTTCARSHKLMRLPQDLPLLVGAVIPHRAGFILSPYSGKEIEVKIPEWITGSEVAGAEPGENFLLPPGLPAPDGEVEMSAPGFVRSPYDKTARPMRVPPLQWIEGAELLCEKTRAPFKLPKKLPLLPGILTGEAGSIRSPYPTTGDVAIEVVDLNDWVPGKVFDCPCNPGRVFALPPDIEEWIVDGTWVPGVPGRVHSPFQNGGNVDLTDADWKPGALVTCPVAKRRFRVPVTKDFPTLALEKAAVHRAHIAEPEQTEKDAADALKSEHKGATAAAILAIWARHDLDTPEKRAPKETGSLIEGRPGFVISPYNKEELRVEPRVWVQQRASVLCASGRRFLLPAGRPHLVGTINAQHPGTVTSPFAPEKPFEVRPWQWKDGEEIKCERSGHLFVLPKNLPAWVPEARLGENKPGAVINPFSPKGEIITINGPDWKDENILTVGGKHYKLPRELPPLVARSVNAKGAEAESPYCAPGKFTHIDPDQWVDGGTVICAVTSRAFVLPAILPAPVFAGTDPRVEGGSQGSIQSPYGKKQRLNIDAADWEEGKEVRCPETKKRVVLPKGLPLLIGRTDPGRALRVLSPFSSGDKWMDVDVSEWIESREITCAQTRRRFRLPDELALPVAELVGGKPGLVLSPFRKGKDGEITVQPLKWVEGGEVEDSRARRRFRLPSELPLLECVPVAGRSLLVKSPFDPKTDVAVPLADWTPGHEVKCPVTKRIFALPRHLDEPVLPARLIEGRPGWIIDPYSAQEIEVRGADWNENATTISAEGRKIALPAKLPPLLALLIGDTPFQIRSPYNPEVIDTVSVRKWIAGKIVKCGGRSVQLPNELPQPPADMLQKSPFPLAAVTRIGIGLLVVAGTIALYFAWPDSSTSDAKVSDAPVPPAPLIKPVPLAPLSLPVPPAPSIPPMPEPLKPEIKKPSLFAALKLIEEKSPQSRVITDKELSACHQACKEDASFAPELSNELAQIAQRLDEQLLARTILLDEELEHLLAGAAKLPAQPGSTEIARVLTELRADQAGRNGKPGEALNLLLEIARINPASAARLRIRVEAFTDQLAKLPDPDVLASAAILRETGKKWKLADAYLMLASRETGEASIQDYRQADSFGSMKVRAVVGRVCLQTGLRNNRIDLVQEGMTKLCEAAVGIAAEGDPKAMMSLGETLYELGGDERLLEMKLRVEASKLNTEAMKLARVAESKAHAEAFYLIARTQLRKARADRDKILYKQVLGPLEKALEMKLPGAAFYLYQANYNSIINNSERAVAALEKGCIAHDVDCLYTLAQWIEIGQVPARKNVTRAHKLMHEAASLGSIKARDWLTQRER